MTTFALRSSARNVAKRRPITLVQLLVRSFYALAGLAALAAVYSRLLLLLADPLFSAIMTLILAMAVTVVAAPRVRRP